MEALVNVGAAGGFADGMETPLPEFGFELMNRLKVRAAFTQPLRKARLRGGFNLDE
jgi:hypothetical protein